MKEYLCQKENKMCQYGGNKRYNYGFVNGTAGYCFKDNKFLDKIKVCPMKKKFNDVGRCLVCLKNPCQCQKEVCCVCGEFAEEKCSHCKNPYCLTHFKTTVMTGNCCSGNEKDYEI